MYLVGVVRRAIRKVVRQFAVWLNTVTRGHLHPDSVTMAGFLMHFVVAYFIAVRVFVPAAILLAIFGLFDTLDGELARLQQRDSVRGMLLDATTDRLKEATVYTGAAIALIQTNQTSAAWCVAACGISLSVSYVKAKGEAALAANTKTSIPHHRLNYIFQDGLMAFEVRITILAVGLLFNQLLPAVMLVTVGSVFTLITRFRRIVEELR
jgi:phosphatidylglycerophosphate synthase